MERPESEAARDMAPSSADAKRTLAPSANQDAASAVSAEGPPKRLPSLRSVSDPPNMNPNSTSRGVLDRVRKPPLSMSPPPSVASGGSLSSSFLEKARMFQEGRLKTPASSSPGPGANGFTPVPPPGNPLHRPAAVAHHRSDPLMQSPSLSQRRANKFGMKLSDIGSSGPPSPAPGLKRVNAPKLSDIGGASQTPEEKSNGAGTGSKLDDFKKYIDADKGWITFDGTATITRTGVHFANGQTFSISLDEVEIMNELGKGNYGTVYKVRHAKPLKPRFGHGLSGVRVPQTTSETAGDTTSTVPDKQAQDADGSAVAATTGKTMAMKEIRLELDDAKFTTILKELVILHECVSPHIIDFYGAFFQEGAVYMCIEYMDGGSIDKLYKGGIPENVLRKITYATVMGLKSLKDEHNIIHRDVKPTNILVNTRGQVKICDFGVSGNLVASIAKTNIGCQSYMAPERIWGGGGGVAASAGGSDGTYSVQSDIWSLGLTIIECAMGKYPYPPEVSSTIFSQLSVCTKPRSPPRDNKSC